MLVTYGAMLLTARCGQAPPVELPGIELASLPYQMEIWQGRDLDSDPKLAASTGAAAAINRVYRDSVGHDVAVHVAAFADFRPESGFILPHIPTLCYTGGGFSLLSQEPFSFQGDGARCDATLMTCQRNGQSAYVLYWYQLAERNFTTGDGMRRAIWTLRRRPTWPPLVKVMLHANVSDPHAAETQLRDLATRVFIWLQKYK